MPKRRLVMWQGLASPSLERCILSSSDAGHQLSGLVLHAEKEQPTVARYRIILDQRWVTLSAEVSMENGGVRKLSLERIDAADWLIDHKPAPELRGCLDVDLEWSPATNTLPIRRLAIPAGASQSVSAAWVRFPTLTVQPLHQTYERIGEFRYRYRAGRFTAELEVDRDGLVLHYDGGWRAVATTATS